MDTQQELKVLKRLLRLLTDEEMKKQNRMNMVIYVITWFALVVVFMFALQSQLINGIAVAIAAFVGMLSGGTIYARIAIKQWPTLSPHIDKESIEARVKQLEASTVQS